MRLITILILQCALLLGCGKGEPGNSTQRLENAKQKLAAASSPESRFYALTEATKEALSAGRSEEAQQYAQELATLLPNYRGKKDYGNAVHDASHVLGRIALREGRIDDSKRYLIEAGYNPGTRQMDYGPNMSLAKDLLEKGEQQVVLDYFELCRKFWLNKRLDEWSQQVKEGKIPDFGASLLD